MTLRGSLLILAVFGAGTACAETPSPVGTVRVSVSADTWIEIPPLSKTEQDAAVGLDRFSQCVVKSKTINIADLFSRPKSEVLNDYDNMGGKNSKKFFEKCVPTSKFWKMEVNIDLPIGRFAQALYLKDFPSLPKISAGPLKPSQADPKNPLFIVYFDIADCVTLDSPAGVDKLLRTPSGSADEFATYSELKPSFAKCLKKGYGIPANGLFLKGSFGSALYRRAKVFMS